MGPMLFQERIAQTMKGLTWNYVLAKIEDIIVITRGDYENHLEVLQQLLERLSQNRLRLRRGKCSFACKEVKYLGYQVSTFGIAPQYEYLDRIRARAKPNSRDELRESLSRLVSCPLYALSLHLFSPSSIAKFAWKEEEYVGLVFRT